MPRLARVAARQGDRRVLENEPAEAVFVLIEGMVEIVRGGTALMSVSAPGALIGGMPALPGKPCSATDPALGEATPCRVDDPGRFPAERPVLLLSAAQLPARRPDNATTCLSDLKVRTESRGSNTFAVMTRFRARFSPKPT